MALERSAAGSPSVNERVDIGLSLIDDEKNHCRQGETASDDGGNK
tara:strand:+ start:39482 stop:39616 length:135 start_codon:yes stop_codon:yes gene_type:complete